MQDKQLNEKESLELISRMICNTQQKMKEGSGTMFLIWGYATVLITLMVWLLVLITKNPQWQWSWFLLPVSATTLTVIYKRKSDKSPYVSTYIDKVINYIWIVLGITGFLLSVISIIHNIPILFIIVLIMGIGTTLTGLVTNFRPLVYSGSLGMASSVILSFLSWKMQLPVFSLIFLFMMILPGHYLNYKANKRDV